MSLRLKQYLGMDRKESPVHWKVLGLLKTWLVITSLGHKVESSCLRGRPSVGGFSRAGDVLIGATFPVHFQNVQQKLTFTEAPSQIVCFKFGFRYYRWVRSMVFAIEEINSNSNILQNISLGFQIFDSCAALKQALQGTFWMLTGQMAFVPNYQCRGGAAPAAVIGDSGSSRSIIMAHLLGLYRVPQVSYFSTTSILSDRSQFLSFFRTVPSDSFQFIGLAQLLQHFGWTWVGLLATDNDYGQEAMRTLKQEIGKMGFCVAFSETLLTSRSDRDAFNIVQVIRRSTANAIVVFLTEVDMVILLEEMVRQKITGKTWIASEAWSTSALLSNPKYSGVLFGTTGLSIQRGDIPELKEFLNSINPAKDADDIFVEEFWEENFGCKWANQKDYLGSTENRTKVCTGSEKMAETQSMYNDVTNLHITCGVYNTVYAIAMAFQAILSCTKGQGPFLNGACADILDFQPWQLLHYIKQTHFKTPIGTELSFDRYGNPLARYDVVNWQLGPEGTIRHVTVGTYDANAPPMKNLVLNESAIFWAASNSAQVPASSCSASCAPGLRKTSIPGKPACCYLCVSCAQGEISAVTDSAECVRCPWDKWPNARQDQCYQRAEEFLGFEEALGAILAVMSISFSLMPCCILQLFMNHRNTPVVKANNRTLSYLLLLSLTFCFLCSLIFIGYPTQVKCLFRQITFGIIFSLCISCILAKTIMVVIAFSATKPKSDLRRWVGPWLSYLIICVCTLIQICICVSWLAISPPFSYFNTHTRPGKLIIECNEGSVIAFWCMLGYLGFLATVCFLIAFLARKLPDSFNEAKCITFSMLAFLSLWVSFIPAYLSTRGKYMVALEIFTILSSSAAVFSCIFFPKCYIILLRPEMNTRKNVMGRKLG